MIQNLLCYYFNHFCGNAIHFLLFHNYCCTLLDYISALQHLALLDDLLEYSLFTDTFSKWCTIFEYYFPVTSACISSCYIWSCSSDCYSFFHEYLFITKVTKNWIYHCSLELDLTFRVACSTYCISILNPAFCFKYW